MKYICVDPTKLELNFSDTLPRYKFAIPTKHNSKAFFKNSFYSLVYFDVLYPLRTRGQPSLDNINGATFSGDGKVAYSLKEPQPWLVAIAAIMWEGLIQGLTWDVIKYSVLHALDKLKSSGIAPKVEGSMKEIVQKIGKIKTRTEVGFSWRQYGFDGKPLNEFFLGLKRVYDKKSEEERLSLRTSTQKAKRTQVNRDRHPASHRGFAEASQRRSQSLYSGKFRLAE